MKNIKNNKISANNTNSIPARNSNSKQSILQLVLSAFSGNALPFFKNPNSSQLLELQKQHLDVPAYTQPFGPVASAKAGATFATSPKVTSQSQGLVFIQKKGSSHATPNPNIISYSHFSGSCSPVVAKATTATAVLSLSKPRYKNVNIINKFIINNVYKLLFNFFKSMYCLISKPVFITTPDKIKIQLFYFVAIPKIFMASPGLVAKATSPRFLSKKATYSQSYWSNKDLKVKINLKKLAKSNLAKVYPNKFKLICSILSKFFNKSVELELIRLHQPYYDSNILVNFLALIINKKNIGACIHRLFNKNIIKVPAAGPYYFNSLVDNNGYKPSPAYLSGLNIKISGRLMREPIIPRITTKKFEKGFTAKGKINYSDLARFTHKNRKGAFTITVKSGQNF